MGATKVCITDHHLSLLYATIRLTIFYTPVPFFFQFEPLARGTMDEAAIAAAASIGTSFEQYGPAIHGNAVNDEFLAFLEAGGMVDVLCGFRREVERALNGARGTFVRSQIGLLLCKGPPATRGTRRRPEELLASLSSSQTAFASPFPSSRLGP